MPPKSTGLIYLSSTQWSMQYLLSRPSLRSFFAVFRLWRNTDVRTFWNASVCNLHFNFCNHIAEIVGSVLQRHPQAISIKTNTEVVGYIHTQGRRKDPCQFYSRLDVDQNHSFGTERPLGRPLSAERSIIIRCTCHVRSPDILATRNSR